MKMVVCKSCGVQVLPNSDGTCPSCREPVVGEKKTYMRPTALERREGQNLAIWKHLGKAWVGYCTSCLLGYIAIIADKLVWLWWPGVAGIALMLFLTPLFLFYGLAERRVYKVYFCYFLLTSLWPMPLLAAAIQLMLYSTIQTIIVVGLCVLNILLPYMIFRRHFSATVNTHRSGLANQYRWDFTKTNDPNEVQERHQTLAWILAPIGSGIGAMLSKIIPRPMQTTAFAALLFILAFIFATIPGQQLAMMQYVKDLEKKFCRPIKI